MTASDSSPAVEPEEQADSTDRSDSGPGVVYGFWTALTSLVSHTLAGVFFAIPGFLAVVLAFPGQDLGYYLIGMVTLISLGLLENLGSPATSEPDLDTSELGTDEVVALIVTLTLLAAAVVSVRLLTATAGAAVTAAVVGTSAAGLWSVAAAIGIVALDWALADYRPYLSIGGLAGFAVLIGLSKVAGLGRRQREGLLEFGSRVGTAR